jgi:pentose-5-phosphate-3-epimerase/putative flippase GtrA
MQRVATHTSLAFLIYRYRYLVLFGIFGFLSVGAEVVLVQFLMPPAWPLLGKAIAGFAAGLLISFGLNARFNFRVPKRYLRATFLRFAIVSCASFVLNVAMMRTFVDNFEWSYGVSRILCSGLLFIVAYSLHRRLSFKLARNFGIAVYAANQERVFRIFHKVGRACDHIHVDLVDATMNASCAPVDLGRIELARRLWPNVPFALHVMSLQPSKYVGPTLGWIDWYLFHLGAHENLLQLIAACQMRGKKAGVVWHQSDPVESLYPYLPHVDFVMVLGIAQPGRSGQPICEQAIQVTNLLESQRNRYGYEVMFDGSVNSETIERIQARYIVAASAVLNAANPSHAIYSLKVGNIHERRAA